MPDDPQPLSPAFPTLEALNQLAERWNQTPQLRHFGARLDFTRVDRVRVVVDPIQEVHLGGMGTDAVNGLVLSALFDLALGLVGWLSRPDSVSATVNLSMTFFKLARGPRVEAEAWLVRSARHLVFAAAEIRDGSGLVVARADGTCAVVPAAPHVLEQKLGGGWVAP